MNPVRTPAKMKKRTRLYPLEKPMVLYILRAIATKALAGGRAGLTIVDKGCSSERQILVSIEDNGTEADRQRQRQDVSTFSRSCILHGNVHGLCTKLHTGYTVDTSRPCQTTTCLLPPELPRMLELTLLYTTLGLTIA